MMKKGQGLPVYAIVIIILGIVILAIALIYIFGVVGKGTEASSLFFDIGKNISEKAGETAGEYAFG